MSDNFNDSKNKPNNVLYDALPEGTVIEIPFFTGYMQPYGALDRFRESHALFYYYIHARRVYEQYHLDLKIQYEGELDTPYNFQQLAKSIAMLYGVEVDNMVKAWPLVDQQCEILGLPKLPDEHRFRHTQIVVIGNDTKRH